MLINRFANNSLYGRKINLTNRTTNIVLIQKHGQYGHIFIFLNLQHLIGGIDHYLILCIEGIEAYPFGYKFCNRGIWYEIGGIDNWIHLAPCQFVWFISSVPLDRIITPVLVSKFGPCARTCQFWHTCASCLRFSRSIVSTIGAFWFWTHSEKLTMSYNRKLRRCTDFS